MQVWNVTKYFLEAKSDKIESPSKGDNEKAVEWVKKNSDRKCDKSLDFRNYDLREHVPDCRLLNSQRDVGVLGRNLSSSNKG